MLDDRFTRRTDFEHCWYRDFCEKFGPESCTESCKKFTQTDYMFQMCDLPRSMWTAQRLETDELEPEAAEILNTVIADCEFFVRKGFNLYLYGGTGSGKTSWAVKIMNNYFAAIAERNAFDTRGLYINVPSFLRDSRLFMKYTKKDYLEYLETIKTCDIVIWDDIGQTDPTNYESQWLYSYINERVFAKKCNIVTSNLTPEQLQELDRRMHSRVCNGADCVHITGSDKRRNSTYSSFMNSGEVDYGTDTVD